MITKALVLGMFESGLLTRSGVSLTSGWEAIADSYLESETKSLFTDLRNDFLSGTPSLKPFENNEALKDDLVIACHFAELAAVTSMYEIWSDMALAYLLKKKLSTATPLEADVRLGSYLLSFGDGIPEMSFRTEISSWSNAESWVFPESCADATFPEDYWSTFTTDPGDILFPRTILPILKSCLEAGTVDTVISDTVFRWTPFAQVVHQVFGDK